MHQCFTYPIAMYRANASTQWDLDGAHQSQFPGLVGDTDLDLT
jgi:hypothetical protein